MADIIKQLPSDVADQISAGEVIERPASVVKELVENSIDADSDKILIEVENGGKDLIRVKDNGSGIKKEEIELAFSRYATSKINNIDDLYSLKTLGFRGEALASIASVSEVEVITKYKSQIKASKLQIKGSKIINKSTAAGSQGTDIRVKNLFFNTPARYKYMKTTGTEFGHISQVVSNEALAYPEISFILKHNQNKVLQTPGSGELKDSILAIYGKELYEKIIPVEFEDRFICVKGYIARPDFNRSSRIYEKFFVNKRTVNNLTLSHGVEEGYRGLLPSGKYPVVFLNIELNQILVDVNVHPAKKEIKFSRNNIIKDVIQKGIKDKLKTMDGSTKIKIDQRKSFKKEKPNSRQQKLNDYFNKKSDINKSISKNEYKNDYYNIKKTDNKYKQKVNNKKDLIKEKIENNYKTEKILGQVDNTYIVVEGDGIYIVDQHAAHERILYEKYYNKYNKNKVKSQPLLTPVNLELTLNEIEIVNKYKNEIKKLGFLLESFGGNSLIIREVPTIIKNRSDKNVLRDIIDNLIEKGQTLKSAQLIERTITYMACRSAVKAGQSLDHIEQENLIQNLFETSNPFRCPHNRPAIIHLDQKQLERGFQRT